MIKTIIFDLGNVLVFFDHTRMINQIAKVCGVPFSEVYDLLIAQGLGIHYEQGLIETTKIYEILRSKAKEEVIDEKLFEAVGDIFQMNDPMLGLVKNLKEMGYELILLSNTCEIHIEMIKIKYPVIHEFKNKVLSFDVKARKPEAAIYQEALKLTQSKPSECLYIDDIKEYVEAAKNLGMEGEHFTGYENLISRLKIRKIL